MEYAIVSEDVFALILVWLISSDLAGPTPSSAELKPTTIGHYSLRGKKLPSSIFEESGSEREEDDDYEYRPPLMKFVRLRSLKTEEEMKGEPSDSGERVSENSKDPTDRLEANNHNVTESDLSKEFALRQPKESVNKDHTNLKALPQPSHKRKRGRPCRLAGDEYSYTAGREQSTKKKRLKIDVTGLPSFTRRKRNKERKATCKYCRRKFCDFTGVTVHVKKFHSKEDDLGEYLQDLKQLSVMKCSICHKEFDNRFQLQLHEDKTHFKVQKRQWFGFRVPSSSVPFHAAESFSFFLFFHAPLIYRLRVCFCVCIGGGVGVEWGGGVVAKEKLAIKCYHMRGNRNMCFL